tara:strand:- start:1374 stop:1892 length:519 start_codon:yes stop_codon:yes gene_type:complete
MVVYISGYLFLLIGALILSLPLILIELSRPRDWLMGGLLLFSGLYLLVERELLRGSINLLVISLIVLFGKMCLEIFQNRWFQLSTEEIKRIGSFERWFESYKQLGQSFTSLRNSLINFFTSMTNQSEKSQREKKWVHPELKDELKTMGIGKSGSIDSNKLINQESTENEKTS